MGNGKDKERESYLFYSKKRKGKIATSSHPLPFTFFFQTKQSNDKAGDSYSCSTMIIQRLRLNLFSSLLAIISFSTGLITAPSKLHSTHHLQSHMLLQKCPKQATRLSSTSNSNLLFKFRTASSEGFGTRARNVATTCQVGDIVVPLCGDLEKRQQLVGRGVYPGVEYLICDFVHEQSDDDNSEHAKDRIASIRPAYPLRAHLERSDWPITVPLSDVPLWLSKTTYEAGTALGTLMLAGTYLVMAAIAATMVRIAVIPSESMIPALMPGDVSVVVCVVTRCLLIFC